MAQITGVLAYPPGKKDAYLDPTGNTRKSKQADVWVSFIPPINATDSPGKSSPARPAVVQNKFSVYRFAAGKFQKKMKVVSSRREIADWVGVLPAMTTSSSKR